MTTPGQTVGPFFGFALPYDGGPTLDGGGVQLHGRVLDGAGEPVPDALLEIWHPDAGGFGRAATDVDGNYAFTVRPGVAFLPMTVLARGLLDRLFTRVYLPDTPDDALLAALPVGRRATLRARADGDGYAHDIVLQGDRETVFLRYRA